MSVEDAEAASGTDCLYVGWKAGSCAPETGAVVPEEAIGGAIVGARHGQNPSHAFEFPLQYNV